MISLHPPTGYSLTHDPMAFGEAGHDRGTERARGVHGRAREDDSESVKHKPRHDQVFLLLPSL